MGDRYELTKRCAYCGEINKGIYYAPTCGVFGFYCGVCERFNFICFDPYLTVKKLEDVKYEEIVIAITRTTTFMNDEEIRTYADEVWNNLVKETNENK